jgi:ParB family transcriptional regulator, chromosome partitioning protein
VSGTVSDPKRRALGRGLDALLPAAREQAPGYGDKSVFSCALEKLVPQKGQPRQFFAKDKIEELAASIKEHGLLEPIVVRRVPGQDKFEIIAGERRWRASQKAGLREALVVVKDVSPKAAFELALIENVQREDLNPVELADRLVREHNYTQETLAERLGKDRTTVANSLRLLKLPATVRARVISGVLSEGHARALLGAPDPSKIEEMAEKCVRGQLSVRAAEALVRGAKAAKAKAGKGAKDGKSVSVRDLELRLTRAAGTKVQVRDQGNKGMVVIPYEDLDHLDRILARVFKLA